MNLEEYDLLADLKRELEALQDQFTELRRHL